MFLKQRGFVTQLSRVSFVWAYRGLALLTGYTENILFNLPYDEERYTQTLEVCALISDLEILEDGDEAEIGERGVCISVVYH